MLDLDNNAELDFWFIETQLLSAGIILGNYEYLESDMQKLQFYDDKGMIYFYYGPTGSCLSATLYSFNKTSLIETHSLPYGHNGDFFDSRTDEHIEWNVMVNTTSSSFEGISIIKRNYITGVS